MSWLAGISGFTVETPVKAGGWVLYPINEPLWRTRLHNVKAGILVLSFEIQFVKASTLPI